MRLVLAPGEQVILKEKPSGHALVWPLIRAALAALLSGWAIGQMTPLFQAATNAAGPAVSITLVVICVAVALWVVYAVGLRRVRRWLSTVYILTSERLVIRHGLGGRAEYSYPLPVIFRVDIQRPVLQRLTSTGSLSFAVSNGGEFTLRDVPNVPAFRAEVVDAISRAQQRYWHAPTSPVAYGNPQPLADGHGSHAGGYPSRGGH